MGLFSRGGDGAQSSRDEVPDTIGSAEGDRLQRAGARQPWFTREAAERRVKAVEQQQKHKLS